MRKLAITLRTILIVVAVVLLIIAAVIYFVEAPVVPEGEEPTLAQKIILVGKERLEAVLLALGVSGITLIGVFAKLIYNSAKRTFEQGTVTATDIAELKAENERLRTDNAAQNKQIAMLIKKQDIVNNALLTTFSLSELPSNLREKLLSAQSEYNDVGAAVSMVQEVVEVVKNGAEKAQKTATAHVEAIREALGNEVSDTKDKPVAPVRL